MTRRGVVEIKLHPFFNGVDWNGVAERKTPAPLKPRLKGPEDTSNYTFGTESTGASGGYSEELCMSEDIRDRTLALQLPLIGFRDF